MSAVAPKPPSTDMPVDGVLVRRPVGPGWLRDVPEARPEWDVTVSLTDAAAAIRQAAELTARGFRPVGTAGGGDGDTVWADFLVSRQLAATQHRWVRSLAGPSGRVYQTSLGPVRMLMRPVLVAHQRGPAARHR